MRRQFRAQRGPAPRSADVGSRPIPPGPAGAWGTPAGNPPGQSEIRYQVGNMRSFLDAMLAQAPQQTLPDGPYQGQRPLAKMDTSPNAGLGVGFLEAWALVCNVLAFYQERLFNEGFVGTATQHDAQFELVTSLDYTPRPAIASDVALVFQLLPSDDPNLVVAIPGGSGAQSVPTPSPTPDGAPPKPQTFETSQDLEARPSWNSIAAFVPPARAVRPTLKVDPNALVLDGTNLLIETGSYLLLKGDPPLFLWYLLRVDAVTEDAVAGTTSIRWTLASDRAPPPVLILPEVWAFRQTARLFGYDAAVWTDLILSERLRYGTPIGGLWRAGGTLVSTDPWAPRQKELPDVLANIRCFAAAADRSGGFDLFAGTTAVGVLKSADLGNSWQVVNQGLLQSDIYSLVYHPRVGLVAGTISGQVFRSVDRGGSWEPISGGSVVLREENGHFVPENTSLPPSAVRGLCVVEESNPPQPLVLFACTDSGVYRSDTGGMIWSPFNLGLLSDPTKDGPAPLTAFCVASTDGFLYLGTNVGLFYRARTDGSSWTAFSDLVGSSVLSLLVVGADAPPGELAITLLVGTDGHGMKSLDVTTPPDPERAATVVAGIPEDAAVNAISALTRAAGADIGPDAVLIAAVSAAGRGGMFRSDDQGLSFQAINQGFDRAGESAANLDRVAAASVVRKRITPAGVIEWVIDMLSAAPLVGAEPLAQWPDYRAGGPPGAPPGAVDLDQVYPDLAAPAWTVVYQSSKEKRGALDVQLYWTNEIQTVFRSAFGISGSVSELVLEPDAGLESFDVRTALALVAPTPMTIHRDTTPIVDLVTGSKIELSTKIPPLLEGRLIAVHGQPAQHVSSPSTGPRRVRAVEILAQEAGEGEAQARVTFVDDEKPRSIVAPAARLEFTGDDDDGLVTEIATVAATKVNDEGRTVIELETPLQTTYLASTVTVFANVVPATNGQTVPNLPLGNGDQSVQNQSFPLPTSQLSPLTYVRVPGTIDLRPQIQVTVNGVAWSRVDTLYAAGPTDRVYELLEDANDASFVRFGDGVNGARLPTGVNNVVATYRYGAGPEGNVPAGTIMVPSNVPLGIQSVTNPLPALGGKAPQSFDEARASATARVTSLERVVTSSDYADLAASFPDISKVATFELGNTGAAGEGRFFVVTAAGPDGAPLDDAGEALLRTALASASPPDARSPSFFTVDTYEPVYFELAALIVFEKSVKTPDDRAAVLAAATDALVDAFSFERRGLAEAVTHAQIYRVLQSVRGVLAARLTALYLEGDPPALARELRAAQPAPAAEPGELTKAQILLLRDSGEGVTLDGSAT